MVNAQSRRYGEAMTAGRVFVTLAALMLLVMSGVALVATATAWVPCDAGLYSDGCLRAMDQPANWDVSSRAWLAGILLCVAAVVLSIHSSSTLSARLTTGALIAVVVGSGAAAVGRRECSCPSRGAGCVRTRRHRGSLEADGT
jgi:hypothetical protein